MRHSLAFLCLIGAMIFTGISAPYEAPVAAEIELRTDRLSVAESVASITEYLAAWIREGSRRQDVSSAAHD